MNNSSEEIVKLVNEFSDFQKENPEKKISIEDFCIHYLNAKSDSLRHETDDFGMSLDTQITALVSGLNRYANHYTKKAMKEIGFNNSEDWFYLVSLLGSKPIKKADLIHQHISEFPSGIEVINRLLKANLILEMQDEDDKRSKKVSLTTLGIEVLENSFPYLEKIGPMAFSKINDIEKRILLNLLKRLDLHHRNHYKHVKDKNLEEAYQVLMN